MAFLNSIAELFHQPTGLWEILILRVFDFITSYGWRILLFTILLKVVLVPLDIYQRVKMRKNQLITERMKPQLDKLQAQYAGDKQTLAQKQMELNKREGFSYFSSCIPMIATMAIFFYLFSGLNNISQYMNLKQYAELYDQFTITELAEHEITNNVASGKQIGEGEHGAYDDLTFSALAKVKPTDATTTDYQNWANATTEFTNRVSLKAKNSVVDYYEKNSKESFLWIKNIWSPDVPWTKPINNKDAFIRNISNYKDYDKVCKKLTIDKEKLPESEYSLMLARYTEVTSMLYASDNNRVNGFLILPILSVGLSFLSQFITSRLQKKSGQESPQGGMAGSMKIMMFMMPIMMGFFALQYTSAFTLYIVINSLMSIIINLLTTLAMSGVDKGKTKAVAKVAGGVVKYGRLAPSELDAKQDKLSKKEAKQKKKKGDEVIKYGRPDPKDFMKK